MQRKLARFALATKAGFKPDQPRVPAGNPDGGQWTGGGGGGGVSRAAAERKPGAESPTRGGHHFVNKGLYEKLPLRPETRKVFQDGVTGRLNAGPHGNSRAHTAYNKAVAEHFDRFTKENNIRFDEMMPDQAQKFLDEIKRSNDPRIRNFNMRLYMREIQYWLRRIPRGTE